ncbi:MAG: DUF559 domain-containing protein [Antricoccus sp.]
MAAPQITRGRDAPGGAAGVVSGENAHPEVAAAVGAGGVLACGSALRILGAWTMPDNKLHIRYSSDARRRFGSGCQVYAKDPPADLRVDPWAIALDCAAGCLSAEALVVAVDSLIQSGIAAYEDIEARVLKWPPGHATWWTACDGRSESGTETLTRFRLRSCGIDSIPQVVIPGIGRVDLLVGRRLVIECDSRAHHTGTLAYESDRRRDRVLVARGFLVVRLSYHQVLYDRPSVLEDLLTIVRRRDHLQRPANNTP